MQDPDLEIALGGEPPPLPSAGFSRRVMAAVRREAAEQHAMPFPWRIVFSAVAISTALVLAAAGGILPGSTLDGRFSEALAWLSMIGTGSFVIVWWSLRLTSRP